MPEEKPAWLQKIAEDTQKIEDEVFKKQTEPPAPAELPKEPPKEGEPAPPVETPSPEQPPVELSPAEPPAELPVPVPSPVELAPAEPPPDKPVDFKHKYDVLKGKYDKEIPRERQAAKSAQDHAIALEDENSRLRQNLSGFQSRIEKLEGKGTELSQSATQPFSLDAMESDPSIAFIKNDYPDVWKALKTALNKTVEFVAQSTQGKIEKVENDVKTISETTAKTAWNEFHSFLDTNVEGWRKVNVDPGFKTWLNETDRYTGASRLKLIQDGITRLDAPTVANFFEDFAKENSAPSAEPDTEPTLPKPSAATKPTSVAPPKGKPPAPPVRPAQNTETITTEHIAKFYDDLRRGVYIGREDQAKAEEKRIERATMEGRVR